MLLEILGAIFGGLLGLATVIGLAIAIFNMATDPRNHTGW